MEEQLRLAMEQQTAYREAMENAILAGIAVVDLQGRQTYVNPVLARMLGWSPDALLGCLPPFPYWPPEEIPAITEALKTVLRGEAPPGGFELRFQRRNGERFDVLVSISPIKDGKAHAIGWLAAVLDISERKRAERALRENEAQTRQILESISDAFISLDGEWRFVYINANAARLAGKTREELLGQRIWDAFPVLANSRFREECQRALREQTPIRFEDYYSVARIWFDLHLYPTVNGLTVFCRDITEQRRSRLEIEALNARLQRAIAETHHRVKNNLQVISSLVDLQVMENTDHVPIGELRRLAQHTSALAVIHDLLTDTARASGDVDVLRTQTTLEKLYPLLQNLAHGRALRFQVEDASLSARQGTGLAVVVNELVSNAVKHGRGAITVTLRIQGDSARLEVRDSGPGFPEGFDARRAAHTGLDLVGQVCRWDLGGEVAYKNGGEGGARVVVTFPVLPK